MGDQQRSADGGRDDETVRTILHRARHRARAVSRKCTEALEKGLRRPAAGPVEQVDPEKLKRIREAPKDVERDDAFERGLAAIIRRR